MRALSFPTTHRAYSTSSRRSISRATTAVMETAPAASELSFTRIVSGSAMGSISR